MALLYVPPYFYLSCGMGARQRTRVLLGDAYSSPPWLCHHKASKCSKKCNSPITDGTSMASIMSKAMNMFQNTAPLSYNKFIYI